MSDLDPDSLAAFDRFVAPMIGRRVGEVWRGAGTAIFLEIGDRAQDADPSERWQGEFTLMIEFSWRIETDAAVLGGSFDDDSGIEEALYGCRGRVVERVSLFGRPPELLASLGGGRRLASFMTTQGDPEWTVFDNREGGCSWVHAAGGSLVFDRSP